MPACGPLPQTPCANHPAVMSTTDRAARRCMAAWMLPCTAPRLLGRWVCVILLLLAGGVAYAQDAAPETPLPKRQSSVAERYEKLEELLLRLADMEAAENPQRAALLRQAAKQSRDKFVHNRMKDAADQLEQQQYKSAVDNQTLVKTELRSILKLLQSEDRGKRIRDEKERYKKLLADLKRNLNNQRSTKARTEGGAKLEDVKEQQKSVTRRSQSVAERLAEENGEDPAESSRTPGTESSEKPSDGNKPDGKDADEDGDKKDGDKKDSDKKDSDKKDGEQKDGEKSDGSKDGKPQDGKPQKGKPNEGKSKDGKPQDGKSQQQQGQQQQQQSQQQQQQQQQGQQQQQQQGQQQQGQQQQGQQQQGQQQQSQQQQSQQQQPQTPAQDVQQQLEKAIEQMKQAEKELDESKRDKAIEAQRKAEDQLRKAIERLENILRQLREEEMQRELARIESRVRRMLAMQKRVLEDTIALAKIPRSQRGRAEDLKAGKLSFEEKKVSAEADRAMLILREEGSSVAFPEVMKQIRQDTETAAEMLSQSKIDSLCQGVQNDVIAGLEEMIDALVKAQRDLEKEKKQREQGKPQQGGGSQEKPLVEVIAELKLIRSMETRIQKSTQRYSQTLDSGETAAGEVLPLLQDLAQRQSRLYKITRDLVLRRNQ
ncbi:MAG: hypothetical protein AAF958_05075 [Planctomycetota bacterium]